MRCKGDYTYYLLNGLRIDVIVIVVVDVNLRPNLFLCSLLLLEPSEDGELLVSKRCLEEE
jgi:hypothetical protein